MIFITGMPGSGKTTVGTALAKDLGLCFYDLDDLLGTKLKHIISEGKTISDEQRDAFFSDMVEFLKDKGNCVVSMFIMKKKHKELFEQAFDVEFFYLDVHTDELSNRLKNRTNHFFQEKHLAAVLKTCDDLHVHKVNGSLQVEEIILTIKKHLSL